MANDGAVPTLDLLRQFMSTAPDAMLVVDAQGRIVLCNDQTGKLFGREATALQGRPIEDLIPARYHAKHEEHRRGYAADPRLRPMGAGLALFGLRASGEEFPVEISLGPITLGATRYTIAAIRDITDRKRIEDELKASLLEKETLLKEVHHRVKNNLQVISALLDLQSDTAADPRAIELLRESRLRVMSMALLHEKLYRSKRIASVPLRDYVTDLAGHLFDAYSSSRGEVELKMDVEEIDLDLDTAITLGLVLNELMSNALKHAFRGRAHGTLRVQLRREGRDLALRVSDDGVGVGPKLFEGEAKSLGILLVKTLVKQLQGEVRVEPGPGTSIAITWPQREDPA